jgi:hypothetical protein
MGTTLDMVRRAATCLKNMSRIPDNRPLFMNFQQRLLALVMSQILDQGVAAIIADVIYECSLGDPALALNATPYFPVINLAALKERLAEKRDSSPDNQDTDEDKKENEDKEITAGDEDEKMDTDDCPGAVESEEVESKEADEMK